MNPWWNLRRHALHCRFMQVQKWVTMAIPCCSNFSADQTLACCSLVTEGFIAYLINARRPCAQAHKGYCSLSVCLCVCYCSSALVRRYSDKMNSLERSSLNSEGFQLADFAKTLSFQSYCLFFTFTQRRWPCFNYWKCLVEEWQPLSAGVKSRLIVISVKGAYMYMYIYCTI